MNKKILNIIARIFMIILAVLPWFIEMDLIDINKLRLKYHNYKVKNIEKIIINDSNLGNREDNLNNHGGAVGNNDYLFYLKDNIQLARGATDFSSEVLLVDQQSGSGIGQLNLVDEWLFFTQGKEIKRMKIDGSHKETIYFSGYVMDMHVLGNWIYFVNPQDDFKIYKMTVNGKNLHQLTDTKAGYDFCIYNNRIYYSSADDGEGYLKSMDLEGRDKRQIANIVANDMVIADHKIYYKDYEKGLSAYDLARKKSYQIISEKVSQFCLAGGWIYYAGVNQDDTSHRGKGLSRVQVNGEDRVRINEEWMIENLSVVEGWLLYRSASEEREYPTFKKISIQQK